MAGTWRGLLLLFGADYQGLPPGQDRDFAVAHLAGVALVAVALILVAARFFTTATLVEQVLAVAIAVNVVLYVISNMPSLNPHEMAVVLPCGAALAGRMLVRETGRALAGKRARAVQATGAVAAPAGVAVLAGYLTGLAWEARHPAQPGQNTQLASWLAAHRLRYGLERLLGEQHRHGGHRPPRPGPRADAVHHAARPMGIHTYAWYVPRGQYANFIVFESLPGFFYHWEPRALVHRYPATRPARTTSAPTR